MVRMSGLAGLLLAVVLTGCGGGGGGGGGDVGGGGAGPADNRVFSATYVPLAAGDRRLYRLDRGFDGVSLRTETVVGPTAVGSQSVWELRDEAGVRSYLARTETALTAVTGPGTDDTLLRVLGSMDLMRFGLSAGQSAVLVDRSGAGDFDGDGRQDTFQLRVTFTVVGFEDLNTALRRFTNAAQVRTEATITLTLASGARVTSAIDTREWYAVGVGRVRGVSSTTTGAQPAETESEDITAYGVGGQRSDTVAPVIASATPADGRAVASVDRVVLGFSEAVDAQSLEGEGVQLVDATGAAVAVRRILAPNLLDLTLLPDAPLRAGPYTVRAGTGIVDWSGNAMAAREIRFVVDPVGPQLIRSMPAAGSEDFPVDGSIALTFDEPLMATAPVILLFDASGTALLQTLPATLEGATLTARLSTPLTRNAAYRVQAGTGLTDLAGNPVQAASATVAFRTDPGPLARPVSLASGVAVMASTLADMDRDGMADLVYAGRVDGVPVVGMRAGLSSGGFAAPQTLFSLGDGVGSDCTVARLVVGDLDGDGRRDVALPCGSFLRVYLQTAGGVYTMERPLFNGTAALAVADVDGNGRDDLLLMGTPIGADVGSRQDWYAYTRSGAGNWTQLATVQRVGEFAAPLAARVADLDGDGKPDLLWADQMLDGRNLVAWALAQAGGHGALQTVTIPGNTMGAATLAVGDINGDGRADIVQAGAGLTSAADNQLLVLLGTSAGGYAPPQTLPAGRHPGPVAIGDIDGDGRADILVARPDGPFSTVGVLLQRADGGFETERGFETTANSGIGNREMTLVEVDGDGLRDLLVGPDLLRRRAVAGAWPAAAAGPTRQAVSMASPPSAVATAATRQARRGWPAWLTGPVAPRPVGGGVALRRE